MGQISQVRLHTTYARVAVYQRDTELDVAHRRQPFTSPIRTEVRLRSSGPSLEIDGTAMREALGIRTNEAFRQKRVSESWAAAAAALDRVVAEGHALGDIAHRRTVADVAAAQSRGQAKPEVTVADVPPPSVSIAPKTVQVSTETVGGTSPLHRNAIRMSWSPPEFDVRLEPPGDVAVAVVPGGLAVGREVDAFA